MVLGIRCVVDANCVDAAPKVCFEHLHVGVADTAGLRAAADLQIRPHAESDDAAMAVAAGKSDSLSMVGSARRLPSQA